ncbi:MAG: glucokinase [Rubrivivax sp.]
MTLTLTPDSATSPLPAARMAVAGYPRLLADIGGTNARFAWLARPGADPAQVRTLSVPAFDGPAEAARAYLDNLARDLGADYAPPRGAAFAVATAVTHDPVVLTNSRWRFSRTELQQALGVEALVLVNDFEALALSLPRLHGPQLRAHRPLFSLREAVPGTVLAVVGPGTGLGVGAVLLTRSGWQALPGEGGHATLAAADALEAAVIDVVRRRYAHVSAERLLSGIGLPLLHTALAEVQGVALPSSLRAEDIVAAALDGSDAQAGQTVDLFCALLGGFAGNVALTLGARGGLFVGGGIVPRFADRFFASAFRERFEAKGRFRDYLAAVPTALITDTLAALGGAALALDAA